jgi:hypothetical protein
MAAGHIYHIVGNLHYLHDGPGPTARGSGRSPTEAACQGCPAARAGLAMARAQADGHSWQQIGDVLGASPQAAYQRFGRPPGLVDTEPASPEVTDAADRAVTVLADWFEERYDAVAATFDKTLAGTFPVAGLAEARAHLAGAAGPYRRLGDAEPGVRQRATTPSPTCRWTSRSSRGLRAQSICRWTVCRPGVTGRSSRSPRLIVPTWPTLDLDGHGRPRGRGVLRVPAP